MAGETTLVIGNVHMPYGVFKWPKYRGCVVRPVEIDCPGEFYDRLAALATKNDTTGSLTITVTGPAGPGTAGGDATVQFKGVFIERVIQVTDQLCRVVLVDKRWVLSRRVADLDFRIQFGDGYLDGTFADTYKRAVELLVESIDVLRNNRAGNAFSRFPVVKLPDGIHLSGNTLVAALQDLLDRAGAALTVDNNGLFHFVANDDLDTFSDLPTKEGYAWYIEPGWLTKKATITGRPKEFRCYYPERCCLRLEGSNPDQSIAHRVNDALAVELEQVYLSKGQYWTLGELLTEYGYSAVAISDRDICNTFFTGTFQGTDLHETAGTKEFIAVHRAIRDGWRTLWRIKFPKERGHIGGWTDWAFGKINPDGSVRGASVECKWVSFLSNIDIPNGGSFIDADATINHEVNTDDTPNAGVESSPFAAAWEGGDASLGIIRLISKAREDVDLAMPGALKQALKVEKKSNLDDDAGNVANLSEYNIIESEEWAKAKFNPEFNIAIYVCATKRVPNDETRWHCETVPGYSDGDVGFLELPTSGELYSVRDYPLPNEVVVGDEGHLPQSDGLGPRFAANVEQVKNDANARAESWKKLNACPFDSFGIAESVMLAQKVEVVGPIREITVEMDGEIVRTRIDVGNLADHDARMRREMKRLADRSFTTAGFPKI